MNNAVAKPLPSRKLLFTTFLISFAASLAIGVYMIMVGDFRHSIELQILMTSLAVMAFSACLLFSGLLINDSYLKILGYAGTVCSLLGLAMWLYLIWIANRRVVFSNIEGVFKITLTLSILAAYLSYASVLLHFRNRRFLMVVCQIIFLAAASIIALPALSIIWNIISPFYFTWRIWVGLMLLVIAGLIMIPVMGYKAKNN